MEADYAAVLSFHSFSVTLVELSRAMSETGRT